MKIHEYQAKAILAKFGVPVPRGEVISKKEEARGGGEAPRHAGGGREGADSRGRARKGGGVKLAKSADEAASLAGQILGMKLVTPQTGPEGPHRAAPADRGGPRHQARALPEHARGSRGGRAGFYGERRGRNGNRGSGEGASRSDPARRRSIPKTGFQPYHARKLAFGLGFSPDARERRAPFLQSLYRAFIETDASLLEINPLRRHRRRPAGRARRENEFRRQRALSPSGVQGPARSRRRRRRSKSKPRNSS